MTKVRQFEANQQSKPKQLYKIIDDRILSLAVTSDQEQSTHMESRDYTTFPNADNQPTNKKMKMNNEEKIKAVKNKILTNKEQNNPRTQT